MFCFRPERCTCIRGLRFFFSLSRAMETAAKAFFSVISSINSAFDGLYVISETLSSFTNRYLLHVIHSVRLFVCLKSFSNFVLRIRHVQKKIAPDSSICVFYKVIIVNQNWHYWHFDGPSYRNMRLSIRMTQ